jgi:hypothetical protein
LRYPNSLEPEIKKSVENWALLTRALVETDASQVKKDILEVLFLASIRLLKFFRKAQFVW